MNVIGGSDPGSDLSVFTSPAGEVGTFPAPASLDRHDLEGTVGAAAPPDAELSYGSGSTALLNGVPLGSAAKPAAIPGLRASLIAELREINGQVNRMMSQVDRAIHRLGEHAGEPLRR